MDWTIYRSGERSGAVNLLLFAACTENYDVTVVFFYSNDNWFLDESEFVLWRRVSFIPEDGSWSSELIIFWKAIRPKSRIDTKSLLWNCSGRFQFSCSWIINFLNLIFFPKSVSLKHWSVFEVEERFFFNFRH